MSNIIWPQPTDEATKLWAKEMELAKKLVAKWDMAQLEERAVVHERDEWDATEDTQPGTRPLPWLAGRQTSDFTCYVCDVTKGPGYMATSSPPICLTCKERYL